MRRVAGHLAPFALAGWTADHWLAAVDQLWRDLDLHPPREVRSPGGLIAWLCARLDPVPVDAADTAAGVVPPRATPCGAPGCDTGWRTVTDDAGRQTSTPCPDCPPVVRSSAWQLETDRLAEEAAALHALDDEDTVESDGPGVEPVAEGVDDERMHAAWTTVLDGTPIAELTDAEAASVILAEPVRDRVELYTVAGLSPTQIDHLDPAAGRRRRALAAVAGTPARRGRRGRRP